MRQRTRQTCLSLSNLTKMWPTYLGYNVGRLIPMIQTRQKTHFSPHWLKHGLSIVGHLQSQFQVMTTRFHHWNKDIKSFIVKCLGEKKLNDRSNLPNKTTTACQFTKCGVNKVLHQFLITFTCISSHSQFTVSASLPSLLDFVLSINCKYFFLTCFNFTFTYKLCQ